MADSVWDLQKALRSSSPQITGRRESEPGMSSGFSDSTTPKAFDIAVPGGFRRHHVQTTPRPVVSKALRDQIIDRINGVYDPFIGSILSQDNDEYDEMNVEERARSLLMTPPLRLPTHGRTPTRELGAPSETTGLIKTEPAPPKSRDSDKTTTLWHALLTLLKSFVGTGILFLPDGFRSGGILFSPLCLAFVAALTLYAMLRLLQCRELVGGTYGHVGFKAYGSWGRRMVQISIIMMQAGFCCTYVIFVAQNMAEVLAFWGHTVDTSMLILLQIAVYIPLSWIRYISYFSISNLIADVFILYGLAFILGNSFWLLATDGPAKDVELFNQQDYPVFIGTSIFTFEGIGLVLPTQSSLNQSRQKRFPRLLSWTVVGLLVFYSFFAGINYITFGSSIAPMVTSSLPRNGWSSSVQFGYSFAQLLSYPLFLFPAVKIMEEMLGFPRRASGQKVAKNCFRAVAVLATVCIAYFGQGRLDLFVSIVGAFCCVPLSLVYPPLFHLKLNPNASWMDKIVDTFVITVGLLTFFYVTYSNLQSWSK
ncbi:Vacuolar amino acid transporter [Phytophthora cinnamomi]|uniref:Vacuolar amino acid transporter n=1 Tax=Phytophthora cinnamomi TaxID=4785 RepID=UPI003559D745|nr:Vacuolar amino acid transporter [Phytophthora cinnamomi]